MFISIFLGNYRIIVVLFLLLLLYQWYVKHAVISPQPLLTLQNFVCFVKKRKATDESTLGLPQKTPNTYSGKRGETLKGTLTPILSARQWGTQEKESHEAHTTFSQFLLELLKMKSRVILPSCNLLIFLFYYFNCPRCHKSLSMNALRTISAILQFSVTHFIKTGLTNIFLHTYS